MNNIKELKDLNFELNKLKNQIAFDEEVYYSKKLEKEDMINQIEKCINGIIKNLD